MVDCWPAIIAASAAIAGTVIGASLSMLSSWLERRNRRTLLLVDKLEQLTAANCEIAEWLKALWQCTTLQQTLSVTDDLGTLGGTASFARGINDSGQVVGDAVTSGGADHAFLYSGSGSMQDLNNLIAPASGWTLGEATAISDSGQIVGYGTNPSGQTHAFLLNPVPEPSTVTVLGVGALGLVAYGLRRRCQKRAAASLTEPTASEEPPAI